MKTIEYEESTFYIGQNINENDELYKTMPSNATWFHLDSETSSHVYCVSGSKSSKLTKEEKSKREQNLLGCFLKKVVKSSFLRKIRSKE